MAVKYKLRSPRGATLMAALLFFLVAAVCGSIILAAATATVSRMTTQAEDARAYYSLTSAAQLIRNRLLQSRLRITVELPKTGSPTFEINPLDSSGNVDNKTFVRDLLTKLPDTGSTVVMKKMTITAKKKDASESLPLVYARAEDFDLEKLYNYFVVNDTSQLRKDTQLIIKMTNDPAGLPDSGGTKFQNTFTIDGGKARQAYWLELTFDTVKVPSGYVDKTDEDGKRTVEFEIELKNPSIQKLGY